MLRNLLYFICALMLNTTVWAVTLNKIPVIVSFSILADITAQIGGDKIAVTSLIGVNQDAHAYSLKPSDLTKIMHSKLLIVSGLGLEGGWLSNLTGQIPANKISVASNGITNVPTNNRELDPHLWNDPNLVAKYYVANIESALINLDPKNKTYYIANANNYLQQLANLNSWVIKQLSVIPPANRMAVTTHDAFAYMARAYQIKFIFAQGVATDSDVSAQNIASLIALIKASKVKTVFLENMTNNQLISQIAKDSGAVIGGKLYSDALSSSSEPANTYINLIRYNVTTLVKAWQLAVNT